MTTVTALPTNTYSAGTYTVPATSLSDAVSSIGIAILRCTSADTTIWPNSTDTISFDLQVSLDGGVTYQEWASGSDHGGILTGKHGEVPTMNIQGTLPAGTNRFMKGSITLSANIKTGATVTVQ